MITRIRIYESQGVDHESADRVFYDLVKPVHERHGAVFIGRYRDEYKRVIVLWSYPDEARLRQIQADVAADPETKRSGSRRKALGLYDVQFTEFILRSTDPVK